MATLSQTGMPGGAETIMGPSRTDDGIVQTTNRKGGESRSGKSRSKRRSVTGTGYFASFWICHSTILSKRPLRSLSFFAHSRTLFHNCDKCRNSSACGRRKESGTSWCRTWLPHDQTCVDWMVRHSWCQKILVVQNADVQSSTLFRTVVVPGSRCCNSQQSGLDYAIESSTFLGH